MSQASLFLLGRHYREHRPAPGPFATNSDIIVAQKHLLSYFVYIVKRSDAEPIYRISIYIRLQPPIFQRPSIIIIISLLRKGTATPVFADRQIAKGYHPLLSRPTYNNQPTRKK